MSEDFRKAETAKNFKELNLQGKAIVLKKFIFSRCL